MSVFKIDMEFADANQNTWGETYWVTANSVEDADTAASGLTTSRLLMLNAQSKYTARRITATDKSRASKIVYLGESGTNTDDFKDGAGSPAAMDPAPPGAGVLVAMVGTDGSQQRRTIRGVNAGDLRIRPDTDQFDVHAGFEANFKTFVRALIKNGFGARRLKTQVEAANAPLKITKVDGSRGDGSADITVLAVPPMDGTQRIVISRASPKDLPALNGRYTVLKVAGNVLTIPYVTPENQMLTVGDLGYAKAELYHDLIAFDKDKSAPLRADHRNTRSQLFRSRGRRRAGARRSSR